MKWAVVVMGMCLCIRADGSPAPVADTPGAIPADEPLFASPTRFDRIGRIVAPVLINGQGPFRLVVDTGANHTTISPALARTLGLVPRDTSVVMLNGVTGAEEVPVVTLNRLQAGDLVVTNARAPVVQTDIMAGTDGILGIAGLQNERMLVDFLNDRITISRSTRIRQEAQMLRIPAVRVDGGLLMVIAKVGGIRVRAVIDTGAERSLGNIALQDALRNRNQLQPPRPTVVLGTTTAVSNGEVRGVPAVRLGDATIGDMNLVFGDFHIFKAWDLEGRPAMLIGMDVLGTVKQLVIDFERGEVYVRS
jgi:predicted aspartyl protease